MQAQITRDKRRARRDATRNGHTLGRWQRLARYWWQADCGTCGRTVQAVDPAAYAACGAGPRAAGTVTGYALDFACD